jgi:hypothetical protein
MQQKPAGLKSTRIHQPKCCVNFRSLRRCSWHAFYTV